MYLYLYLNRHFGTVDIMGIDILGIDIMGVDILEIDISAPTLSEPVLDCHSMRVTTHYISKN